MFAFGRLGWLQWPANSRRGAGWKLGVTRGGASYRSRLECRAVFVPAWSGGAMSGFAAFEQASGADAVKLMRLSFVSSRRAAQRQRSASKEMRYGAS